VFGLSPGAFWDIELIAGRDADREAVPDVFIELPHGATETAHLEAAKVLTRNYPSARYDLFFRANTDQGSPEYGRRLAELLTDPGLDPLGARRKVLILRSTMPRTILDVNRLWARSEDAVAAGLTRGLAAFVTEPEEVARFEAIWHTYDAQARRGYALVCGNGGFAFNLHTYAPITVAPVVGEPIVDTLQRAYAPENVDGYPKRPIVQLITADRDGPRLAPTGLIERLVSAYAAIGVSAVENEPFVLHPSTSAWAHAARHPNQTITIEISRAELARTFDPFTIMDIDAGSVERMTVPIARAFSQWRRGS